LKEYDYSKKNYCPKCKNKRVIKSGSFKKKQRYKCLACNYRFIFKNKIWSNLAYSDHSNHKQTYKELEIRYNKSSKTIRKYFDQISSISLNILLIPNNLVGRSINLLMDTTYFINREQGTEIGVVLFRAKEAYKKDSSYQNILRIYTSKSETVEDYIKGIRLIKQSGYKIKSFTVDNKSGLIKRLSTLYPTIPVQLCLFHFVKAVNKYITRNPKNKCDKELKLLLGKLKTGTSRFIFKDLLIKWILSNIDYLQQKNFKGRYLYHDTTISALNSINRNLELIFTSQKYPYLSIPNTNNSMEGGFGHLKPKVILHRGLSENRKKQMIDCLLMHQNSFD
jgi:hypothetical protein